MPRGGRRPGAGAPLGNLNGFKTGRRSPRARRALEHILNDPRALRAFAELVETPAMVARRRARAARKAAAPGDAPQWSPTVEALIAQDRAQRLLARIRKIRAMLVARNQRDDKRKNSWRTLLAEEMARLGLPSPPDGEAEGSPGRRPGVRSTPNQTLRNEPASAQSKDREKRKLTVEAAIRRSAINNDFSDPARWPPSVLDDPLLWGDGV